MVNANALVWGAVIFFLGIGIFWVAGRLRLKTLKWISLIVTILGASMAVFGAIPYS